MMNGQSVEAVIARALQLDPARVTASLAYQDIPEWDSFAHVQLMLALEDEYGLTIDNELMLRLGSVAAIRAFAEGGAPAPEPEAVQVLRGLNGVHVDRTEITHIDGAGGRLAYRGYDIHDLAAHAPFEEVIGLLIDGELPGRVELEALKSELDTRRAVPGPVLALLEALKDAHPADALRTAVSALGALGGIAPPSRQAGLRLTAQVPLLIAAHHALRQGRRPPEPQPGLPLAHDFLRMLTGREPPPEAVRIFSQCLIVHADHSSNASAFAARIAISTGGGLHEAITAALAVFAGPLHGGAIEDVLKQIDSIGSPANAAAHVRELQSRNEPVAGFGHRVYRVEDPRVRHFSRMARQLSEAAGDMAAFDTVEALVAAMAPYERLGTGPNVDLYAGLTYRLLGLRDDLAVPLFVAGRMAGWVAQALEQHANNVLIRPLLHYAGPAPRAYVPLELRGTPA